MRRLAVLLGVPIDTLSFEETLDKIDEFVQDGRATGKVHQVATVNADFVVKAAQDPELRYLLQEAHLATADGMPLVWAARLLNVPLKERVTGADLVPALAERAAQKGYSIYFFGAAPGVAQKAADILKQRFPSLKVAGIASPPYTSVLEMDPSVLLDIRSRRPDILLVALGNPKQEKWIGMYGPQLRVPVLIGVGGSLDFIAGQTKRAPVWMQKTGLEWFYRLVQEPRRLWRRYVVDLAAFSVFFVRQWWIMRKTGTPTHREAAFDLEFAGNKAILRIRGQLVINLTQSFLEIGKQALEKTPHLLINFSDVDFVDSSGIGSLVDLAKQAREAGGELALVSVPSNITRTLSVLRLDKFFLIYPDDRTALSDQRFEKRASEFDAQQPDLVQGSHIAWQIIKGPRRIDASNATEFKEACSAQLEQNPNLILDFSEMVFLASAGLAVLVQLHQMAIEKKGQLRVVSCSQDVLRTIHLVRLDRVLSLFNELPSALA